jgi:DNA uptake protein and related DNA-binding proteins
MLINGYYAHSQSRFNVDKWREYIEEISENIENEALIEALYTDLSYLSEHPMDINTLNVENLKKLPFLSDRQIDNLVAYKKRYGNMASVYELKNVEEMDLNTIELLLPFIYIGDITVNKRSMNVDNLLKYGRNSLFLRYDKGFQHKKGYKQLPDSILSKYPNRKYLGEDFYTSLRYSYTFDDRVQFGFVAEKDGGEAFMNSYHKGYDYYSIHLLIKDMKRLKSLALGDYRMSFGQGLIVSNDFTPSRSSIISQAERRNNGFRRHFSTNENDFFRGVATTVNLNKIDVSFFYSDKKMDGIVNNDTIYSIKTDGYHRLQRDIEKKNALSMRAIGGNIRYVTSDFMLGLTAMNYSFGGYNMQPKEVPYNVYYFRGKSNFNIGVDYMWKNKSVKFYGETAMSANKATATLNAIQLTPASYISLLLLYRNYSKEYHAYYGNAFSQNSSVINEQGVYMGFQIAPIAYWKVSAYMDVFRFPWLKYGVDSPSSGIEYMTQVDYTNNDSFSFYVRYKYKQTEKNSKEGISVYKQHRTRLQCLYGSNVVQMRSSLDGIISGESKGWLAAQGVGYKPENFPLQLDLYAAYFNADDSYSSIYSYEKNVLYTFYRPSFYGEGFRLSFVLRYNPIDRLTFSAKMANTHYFDRSTIGTDLEEIEGNDKTDMSIVLNWKF